MATLHIPSIKEFSGELKSELLEASPQMAL
jgi:hypothetical protein